MKELINKFNALTAREQTLVKISAAVCVVALFYFVIWQPLNNAVSQQQTLKANQQELLAWVSESATRAQQLRRSSSNTRAFSGSLTQAVNRTTGQFDIAVSRMQPQGDELQVWVDQAPFNNVLGWLQSLEKMGIVILQADIAETDTAGHIKIRRLQLGKA